MTTSSVVSWELTRDDIIKSALRKCGVLAKGQTPSSEDYSDCSVALNALIQLLAVEGMPLWKRTTSTVTMVDGTQTYTVSNVWKIAQVVLADINNGVQIDMTLNSLYDFNRLPDSTTGIPTQYTYAPGLENGVIKVWPIPNSTAVANKRLRIVYQKEFDNFNASTDTPDFPVYWTEALIYGLAHRIAPEYGVPLQDRQQLEIAYSKAKEAAEGYGDEDGSLYIIPDRAR